MKRLKHIGLVVACIGFLLISCGNENVNEVFEKESFLVGMGASEGAIFEDVPSSTVPLVIGNTLSNDAIITLSISPESGVSYGIDFITVPDGSSGTITLNLEAGATEAVIEIIPVVTLDIDTRKIVFTLQDATGGIIIADGVTPFELSIVDQTLNLNVVAYTGFEEPLAGDINNYAAQAGVEQVNVSDVDGNILNSVDYVSVGGEMGFNTSYVPGQEGGEDTALYFGVTNVANEPDAWNIGSFRDGLQAYSTSDADGLMEIVFDQITIPESATLMKVRLSTYFIDSTWETSDEFDVFWRTSDGDEMLLSFRSDGITMTDNSDGTGNLIIDDWYTFDAFVSNIKSGSLVIQIGTNSGSEVAFIDAIEIGVK